MGRGGADAARGGGVGEENGAVGATSSSRLEGIVMPTKNRSLPIPCLTTVLAIVLYSGMVVAQSIPAPATIADCAEAIRTSLQVYGKLPPMQVVTCTDVLMASAQSAIVAGAGIDCATTVPEYSNIVNTDVRHGTGRLRRFTGMTIHSRLENGALTAPFSSPTPPHPAASAPPRPTPTWLRSPPIPPPAPSRTAPRLPRRSGLWAATLPTRRAARLAQR